MNFQLERIFVCRLLPIAIFILSIVLSDVTESLYFQRSSAIIQAVVSDNTSDAAERPPDRIRERSSGMRSNGLIISYENGTNHVLTSAYNEDSSYPVGNLMCLIFQGEILYDISRILQNCINVCPMNKDPLTQDSIEDAEHYVLSSLLYDDFYPAQRISQGSFIRVMEYYRALDSQSMMGLLQEELQRVNEVDMPFNDIGFSNVGTFLRLCFNNYYVDLENAISFFTALASKLSGSANEQEMSTYSELLNSLQNPDIIPGIEIKSWVNVSGRVNNYYVVNSFLSLVVFEFDHMENSDVVIRRCQNPDCGKFFTAKRSDAKYCNFPSPQNPARLCKDYYPQLLHRKKLKGNDLDHLIKNAYGKLYNQKRRHPDRTDEVSKLISKLQIEAEGNKQDVLQGKMTMKAFEAWLNSLTLTKGDYYE
jgi:hypothetical protein